MVLITRKSHQVISLKGTGPKHSLRKRHLLGYTTLTFILPVFLGVYCNGGTYQVRPISSGEPPAVEGKLQKDVPGEYILTLVENNINAKEFINKFFKKLQPTKIKPVKRGTVYLLRFKINPGLKELKIMIKSEDQIKDIQPNFIYRIN